MTDASQSQGSSKAVDRTPANPAFKDSGHSTGHLHYLGRVLDGKYRLERLLGQGGMGAVYLSTHLGTGRYVAVKLITPQFMRNSEFVERFKREARAAGRLRHPNIVDVTDFGVTTVDGDSLAYLVMEYLDGCTLGDVLAEEKKLPLNWAIEILDQVCSALHDAHRRGVIHRDLKPANIWLEPNVLGGYRVKVLDFGIAKLAEAGEEPASSSPPLPLPLPTATATQPVQPVPPSRQPQETVTQGSTAPASKPVPATETSATDPTQLITRISPLDSSTGALTRVGAILGTPAFMSPEQCRGTELDARSDVYSIGVIAYLMLCGTTPFTGDQGAVLKAHQETRPKPPRAHNRKLPKQVSRILLSALEKDPADRPQTAVAFAQALRARTENLGSLFRRAIALYSENFPSIFVLSLIAHVPVLAMTFLEMALRLVDPNPDGKGIIHGIFVAAIWLLNGAASFITASTIAGVIAVMVTQIALTPLKPLTLTAVFDVWRKRWRPFLLTGFSAAVRIVIGFILFVIPGPILMARCAHWAPVVLLEGLTGKAALKRSAQLASRSWFTVGLAVLFQTLAPILAEWLIARIIGPGTGGSKGGPSQTVQELSSLGSIFVLPLVSIVMSLVYLKMRQLAGEEMSEVIVRIEEAGSRPKWAQRMQSRVDSTL